MCRLSQNNKLIILFTHCNSTLYYTVMLKSIQQFARNHKLPFDMSHTAIEKIQSQSCRFCNTRTPQAQKTYQNVGLVTFIKGFTDRNVVPLCSVCYRTRYGMNMRKYVQQATRIVSHLMKSSCKTYRRAQCPSVRLCIPDQAQCVYCASQRHITMDRIDPSGCYSTKNTQLLCYTCNRMKSNLLQDEFLLHMQHVARKYRE